MASYHMTVKVGKIGKGVSHADYITRSGKYKDKDKADLEHAESGNLPTWADGDSKKFWKEADERERSNGNVYREFEVALPRELSPEQRLGLVKDFMAQEIGMGKTYTFAIHNPSASIDGGEQPHAHIMFSDRLLDGVERGVETHFKRFNAKDPSKGGCQKDNAGKEAVKRKEDLRLLRGRWAQMQNEYLEKYGHEARVDSRTLKEQGIDRQVEPHYGVVLTQSLTSEIKLARVEKAHGQGINQKQKTITEVAKKIADAWDGGNKREALKLFEKAACNKWGEVSPTISKAIAIAIDAYKGVADLGRQIVSQLRKTVEREKGIGR